MTSDFMYTFSQSQCNRGCLVSSDAFRRDFFGTT